MGAGHHGSQMPEDPESRAKQQKLMDRLLAQFEGTARREYSQGRIKADDDGDLALAVTADREKNVVIISFGKPVDWFGMGPAEVNGLINLLMEKLRDLGVPATISI